MADITHIEWLKGLLEKTRAAQAELTKDAEGLERALKVAVAENLQRPPTTTSSSQATSPYHGLRILEMLNKYADSHDGFVRVTTAAQEFVRLGLWTNVRQARSSIYPTLKAAAEKKGTWQWASKGTFMRVQPPVTNAVAPNGKTNVSELQRLLTAVNGN